MIKSKQFVAIFCSTFCLFRLILKLKYMENVVAQRIKAILKQNRISVVEFSKMAGMPQTTISRQLRGNNPIGLNLIESVLNSFPDVSAEWLMRGEGQMLKDTEPVQKETDFIDIFLKGICNSNPEELDEYQNALTSVMKLRNMNHTN